MTSDQDELSQRSAIRDIESVVARSTASSVPLPSLGDFAHLLRTDGIGSCIQKIGFMFMGTSRCSPNIPQCGDCPVKFTLCFDFNLLTILLALSVLSDVGD